MYCYCNNGFYVIAEDKIALSYLIKVEEQGIVSD